MSGSLLRCTSWTSSFAPPPPRLNSSRSNVLRRLRRPTECAALNGATPSHTGDGATLHVRRLSELVCSEVENVVIIGSGPAGYTAAIYCARSYLKPLVFEGFQVGGVRGGQLMTTTEVENFPGFPEGITGPDLMDRMRLQAERWGAELYTEDVEFVDLSKRPFTVRSTEREVTAHSLIVATGATARRLGIPSEEKFWSNGISACAICDGASPTFKNQELAVVGGGDSATEEAIYLTKYAKHVHLLVRGGKMRASNVMQERVLSHPKVTVHYNTSVIDAYPDRRGAMAGLNLSNGQPESVIQLPVRGLFYGIGHTPNSVLIKDQVALDDEGYVITNGSRTSVHGVFAAGDLGDREWRQAITAAGSGCMAALSAERYLTAANLTKEYKTEDKVAVQKEEEQKSVVVSEEVDLSVTRHRGQYALRKLYHESDRLLVVFYSSPQCGPCRTLKPIFNSVVTEYTEKVSPAKSEVVGRRQSQVHFVEIDIEEDQEIAEAAGVSGTPTIQFFKAKERLHHLPGVKMKKQYRELIDASLDKANTSV